jgi:hypothetical protein
MVKPPLAMELVKALTVSDTNASAGRVLRSVRSFETSHSFGSITISTSAASACEGVAARVKWCSRHTATSFPRTRRHVEGAGLKAGSVVSGHAGTLDELRFGRLIHVH